MRVVARRDGALTISSASEDAGRVVRFMSDGNHLNVVINLSTADNRQCCGDAVENEQLFIKIYRVMKTVLFTGEAFKSQAFRELLGKEAEKHLLHIPLERTRYHTLKQEQKLIDSSMNDYTSTVYGSLKNAHYFLKYVEQQQLKKQVLNQIHLVTDHPTRHFLEENGIPAILPRERAKGIDILEFLLRISTQGNVLYPTTDQHTEEIPGLLKELKMGVTEFTVCAERSLTQEELDAASREVEEGKPDGVIFHDRASVNRVGSLFQNWIWRMFRSFRQAGESQSFWRAKGFR